jgi:hypothetical protein
LDDFVWSQLAKVMNISIPEMDLGLQSHESAQKFSDDVGRIEYILVLAVGYMINLVITNFAGKEDDFLDAVCIEFFEDVFQGYIFTRGMTMCINNHIVPFLCEAAQWFGSPAAGLAGRQNHLGMKVREVPARTSADCGASLERSEGEGGQLEPMLGTFPIRCFPQLLYEANNACNEQKDWDNHYQ